MVIRTCVTAGKCSEIVLDVERLHEVHVLSCHELEDISDDAGSYVSLRHEHAYVLVEPLRIESRTAAGSTECCLVDVVVYVAVDVVLLGELLDAEGSLHASDELVILDVIHHPVLACKLVGILLHFLIRKVVDLCSVVAVRKIVDLRTDLGEEVIIVNVGAPHGLVHVCHETHVRVAEDGACPRCVCVDLEFLGNLLTCAHDGLHVLTRHPLYASGSLERTYESTRTEIIHEIILVESGLECHLRLRYVAEYNRDLGTVAEESYPCEVLAP